MENELKNLFDGTNYPGKKLTIFTYPAPVLKKIAPEVTEFTDELKELIIDMLHTMYMAPGIGLAAPQVGKSLRLFVSDIDFEREEEDSEDEENPTYKNINLNPRVFINPKITAKEGEILFEEGCLSVPGIYEKVKRFEKIKLEYQDINGEKHELHAEGLESVCLQHELDHLNGIVFIEKLSPLKQQFVRKQFQKQQKRK